MKRFSYYLASILVLAVSVAGLIPSSPVVAATLSKADHIKQACNATSNPKPSPPKAPKITAAQIKQLNDACIKGFNAGISPTATTYTKTITDTCYTTIFKGDTKAVYQGTTRAGACEIGYIYGYDHSSEINKAPATTPKAPSTVDPEALAACSGTNGIEKTIAGGDNHDILVKDCQEGWAGAGASKKKDDVCSSKKGVSQTACEIGFDLWTSTKGAPAPAADEQLDCDASESPLSWILCPIIDTLASLIDGLDHIITQYMEVDTSKIFDSGSDTSAAYHAAWQSFRNIALGLMVAVGLVILISQALGVEILDAYTIRKTLPRLLIAAIGISLSWPLMHFLIDASNWLGFGIRRLIYFPFTQNGLDATIDLNFGGGIGNVLIGSGALAVGAVGTGIWLLLGGITVIASLAASGALAVMLAVLVLVLRQIAIVLLMLLAPMAIIAFALPNTQKFYKLWWESFSKALLMFPLIAAFIATGRVFAAISFSNKGDPISQLVGFIAYIAPYFLIPLTFRFAGGFVSQLGGFANDRSRGAFDRLKKQRQGTYQSNAAKLKAGTRLEGKRWIPGSIAAADRINEASKGVGTGWNGRYGLGKRGERARRNVDQIQAAEVAKEEGMQAVKGWNDVNRVMAMGMGDERRGREGLIKHLMSGGDDGTWTGTRAQAEAQADKAVLAAKVSGNFTKAHGVAAFQAMARDGTAIRDTDDLAELAAIAGQGDKNNTFDFAANAASVSRQVGRSDLAAASEPIGALAFSYGDQLFHGGQATLGDGSARHTLSHKAWESGAGGEVAYSKFSTAKGRTVRNDTRRAVEIMTAHKQAVESGQASPHSQEEVQFAAATLMDTQNAIDNQYGKLNNRKDAALELAKDGGALDWYLDTATTVTDTAKVASNIADGTPVYDTSARATTNREVIQSIVGDRYANLTPEQRQQQQQNNNNP